MKRSAANGDIARLDAQSRTMTFRAGAGGDELGKFFTQLLGLTLFVTPFQTGNDTIKTMFARGFSATITKVLKGNFIASAAMQDDLLNGFRQILPRGINIEAIVHGQRFEHAVEKGIAPIPAFDGARRKAHMRKSDDASRVEERHAAKAIALGARAHGVVERENARFKFGQRVITHRAGKLGRKQHFLACVIRICVHEHGQCLAIGVPQRGFKAFRQALFHVGPNLDAVNDGFDGVFLVFFQRGNGINVEHFTIDTQANETLCTQFIKQPKLLALTPDNEWRQNHQLGVFGQLQNRIDHLRHGLCGQFNAVMRAAWRAGAGKQQAQVIVNFGDGANCRTRVMAGGFLLDGNGRRKPFDQINIGFLHQLQKLSGVGRKRFHIASLALGVQCVKRQRRFARAGKPGNHHEFVVRQVDIDVFEVVGAGTADANHGQTVQDRG